MNPSSPPRARWRRLILAAAFLYLAWSGWMRMQQALLDAQLLRELGAQPGPGYLAASGAAWGVLGLVGAVLVYARRRWAGWLVLAGALFLAASYWVDFVLFTRAAEMMVNWPFALGATLAGLLFCAWVVWSTTLRVEPPGQAG